MRSGARCAAGRGPGVRGWGLVVLALLATACRPAGGPGTRTAVSDSVYVEVMARLVLLDSLMGSDRLPEGTSRDSMRSRVLRSYGVRGDELLAFARERGTRPERMEAIWGRIYELSDSLEGRDWLPADPDAGGAGGEERR